MKSCSDEYDFIIVFDVKKWDQILLAVLENFIISSCFSIPTSCSLLPCTTLPRAPDRFPAVNLIYI